MSEINNLSDIKDNFDTIKSLLNSIRAQDVLNTGDMSKLLTTINNKLDKLDKEEHLELMNSVLATIKQTLDERHSVLVSKFSTIESLFSNILKNSVDSLKSSEIKELFDIIATNLSVFSREVVAQKDTLTDIILRIEELRNDDSSSSMVVSNVEALKRDLERFNNGFESIIVNLNDNFSSIVHSLSEIREKTVDNHYDKDFENLYMTSNSLLLAVQALDKKSIQVEETLATILAKTDSRRVEDKLSELSLQNKEIYNSIGELAVNCNIEPLYQKIDNATTLIGGLKDILQNVDADSTNQYISKLSKIEAAIEKALDEDSFNKLRTDLEAAFNQIANTISLSQNDLYVVKNELETVSLSIKALDIHVNFQNIQSTLTKSEVNIKTYISDLSNKFSQLFDLTFQRTVEDIKQKVDALGAEIKSISLENIEALSGSLIGLKSGINELEASYGEANGVLFKNISERLGALENTLAALLNTQSISLSNSSSQITELTSTLNLKMDSVSAEFALTQNGIDELTARLNSLLSLDFTGLALDIKQSIIDSKAELDSALVQGDLNLLENLSDKFEQAKIQVMECEKNLSGIYRDGLAELRSLLNSVTSTLIDIMSYVSVVESKNDTQELEKKLSDIDYSIKDCSIDVIEKLNSFIKENITKIDNRLVNYDLTSQTNFQNLATKLENNSAYIRDDLKTAYKTLETIKADIAELKEYVIEDINNNPVRTEVIDRMAGLKNFISEKLDVFESTSLQLGMERLGELNELNNKVIEKIDSIPDVNRGLLQDVRAELVNNIKDSLEGCISQAMDDVKSFVEVSNNAKDIEIASFKAECENIVKNFENNISKDTERSQLIQLEISDKLDTFGNTLYRLVGNGGISINEAFEKIDDIANAISDANGLTVSAISERIEKLGADISDVLANDTTASIKGLISNLIEKSEASSKDTVVALQQVSNNYVRFEDEVNASLEFIRAELAANTQKNVSADVLDAVEDVRGLLNGQLADIDKLYSICQSIEDNQAQKELLEILTSLKSEIISQIISMFNQISFSAEQEEIINFIKVQQDELKDMLVTLAAAIDADAITTSKVVDKIGVLQEDIAHELVTVKTYINNVAGIDNDGKYSLLSIESDLVLLKTTLANIRDNVASEQKLDEVVISLLNLKSNVDSLKAEIPNEAINNIKEQIDILLEGVNLNEELTSVVNLIKSKVENIGTEQQSLKKEVEASFSDVIKTLSVISDAKELKSYINTGLSDLYNNLTTKMDASAANAEIIGLITAVMAKQDANLSQIVARMDFINNEDVVGALGELKAEVVTQLLSVFNQISFEADTMEIKASIEDTRNDLKQLLTDITNEIKSELELIGAANERLIADVSAKLDLNNQEQLGAVANVISKLDDLGFANSKSSDSLMMKLEQVENSQTLAQKEVLSNLSEINAISKDAKESILSKLSEDTTSVIEKIEDAKTAQAESVEALFESNSQILKTLEANQVNQLKVISNILASNEDLVQTFEEKNLEQLEAITKVFVENDKLSETIENNHIYELKAISEVAVSNKELVDSIEHVKSQLKSIQQSDGEGESYSLTDIEADLAKLRLLLSDIKSNHNKKEFEQAFSSLDIVINQIQILKDFIPVEKVDDISDNTIEVLDLLEGLASELKGLHITQDDIIGHIKDAESSVNSEIDRVNMSLDDFANEIKEFTKDTFASRLAAAKNDIVTQILGIINQISFVEEQEEIISHIDDVQSQLNLISSGSPEEMGEYSLLDIETDMAKLRVALEDIKMHGRGAEIDSLVEAIAQASDTLEYLKTEIPNHEISEVRAELEKIANDIISISIRTNKLLISSDESYKDLKEHIETFQSVMDDVDERTKNLYEEVGMDKIESQVTSIKDIVGRQEQTNQVFNEVFEYLAEWVDSTGEKIGYITDKLNNTEDINDIKLSLEELRTASSVKFELDAQSEKIDGMESKLNVIIESLEPTFQNQQERMQALERKVNRIVDFFEPAFTKQQERINKLESMLDKILDVVSSDNGYGNTLDRLDRISEIISSKDDTQLVKKLTSFEKQISKLNKSVEKLTTYANEK